MRHALAHPALATHGAHGGGLSVRQGLRLLPALASGPTGRCQVSASLALGEREVVRHNGERGNRCHVRQSVQPS
jgi:hypothetical protein